LHILKDFEEFDEFLSEANIIDFLAGKCVSFGEEGEREREKTRE